MAALVNGYDIVISSKHPAEKIRLPLDWTDFADGATITNSDWVNATPAVLLTLSGAQVDGLKTSVLVADGTTGQTAFIENHVTFSDGRIAVYTFEIIVATKVPA